MGLGNVDYGDDGFGVRLAEAPANRSRVRSKPAPASRMSLGHRSPARLRSGFIGRVADEGFDHVIFLDAVEFGGAPGSVVLLNSDEMAARFPQISTHKLSLGLLAKRMEANGTDQSLAAGRAAGVAPAGRRADPGRPSHLELLLDLLRDCLHGRSRGNEALTRRNAGSNDRMLEPRCLGSYHDHGGDGMTPEQSVIAAIVVCIAGAVLTLLASRNKTAAGWLAFVFTLAAAVVMVSTVAHVLIVGPGQPAEFPIIPQIGFALRVYVDGLTAVFLLLAALISVPAALYSIVYMRNYEDYSVARYYPVLPALPGRDVRPGQHHGHDVVLLHLLADDDPAGLRAHPVRAQEPGQHPRGQQVSDHDADRLRGHDGRRRAAGRDRRGGQRQREPEVRLRHGQRQPAGDAEHAGRPPRRWPSRCSWSASASRWACGRSARSGCRTRTPPRRRR